METNGLPFAKPEPRKRTKRRKQAQESAHAKKVRAACVYRDGPCRMRGVHGLGACDGPSEWAHLEKRSQTRGMAPERRHSTRLSLMACTGHHQRQEAGRIEVVFADEARGCDGPLAFRVGATLHAETWGEHWQERQEREEQHG